jgi:HAE1 family hydrophobic/amphiphilic exporter-1
VGGDSAQVSVDVRPADLAAAGIGIDQIVAALRAQNLAAPVGNVTTPMEQESIRLQGRFERPEDFAGMVVASRNGQLITLGQVANVTAGAAQPTSAARFNGTTAIGLGHREVARLCDDVGERRRESANRPTCRDVTARRQDRNGP